MPEFDVNPADELQAAASGRVRETLYASEAMLRVRLMRPPAGPAAEGSEPLVAGPAEARDGVDGYFEGFAKASRHVADDVATPGVDEGAVGERQSDLYRQMAATHRAVFGTPAPRSAARVPAVAASPRGRLPTPPVLRR